MAAVLLHAHRSEVILGTAAQVSYMLWGIGMTLSIIVLAMYFHR